MMKIYTPKEWLSAFRGCPSLIIDDNGLIWAGDEYYKILFGEPSGKIDFEKGYIYGEDYAKLMATPIGILEKVNDVIKVYDYQKGRFSTPVLYIENGKIYTPDQFAWSDLGSDASGYIAKEEPSHSSPVGRSESAGAGSSSGGFPGCSGIGWLLGIGLALYCIFMAYPVASLIAGVIILALWYFRRKNR